MDFYPFNLVLAVIVASITIFLGFLPTRNIRSEFFAPQIVPCLFIWACIAFVSPSAIRHYYFFICFLCFASWLQFRRDRSLSGKMWLSIASGLGISVGVMLILAVTPRAYPPGLSDLNRSLLLASIYLGGAVIGLAYVCHALTQGLSNRSGVTKDQVQRYVGLLVGLVVVRAGVLLALLYQTPEKHFGFGSRMATPIQPMLLLGCIVVILPVLAFVARRVTRSGSTVQATSVFVGICFVGILAETLARLLVL